MKRMSASGRFGQVVDEIGGRRAVLAHPHVERSVLLEGKAPLGPVELHRGDAEIEHDAVDVGRDLVHVGEIGLARAAAGRRSSATQPSRHLVRQRIAIDADDLLRPGVQQSARIAALPRTCRRSRRPRPARRPREAGAEGREHAARPRPPFRRPSSSSSSPSSSSGSKSAGISSRYSSVLASFLGLVDSGAQIWKVSTFEANCASPSMPIFSRRRAEQHDAARVVDARGDRLTRRRDARGSCASASRASCRLIRSSTASNSSTV